MDRIVDFYKWCKLCKYKNYPEKVEPCCDCLEEPVNEDSSKPIMFKEKDK